jgi:hypothetical protein
MDRETHAAIERILAILDSVQNTLATQTELIAQLRARVRSLEELAGYAEREP